MVDKRYIEVVSYQERWERDFKKEAYNISKIMNEILIDIYHIGSTSIPGIKAKPVIDIMVVVRKIDEVDKFNKDMTKLGYEPKGEFGIENRRFFMKGGNNRTHHVHIFEIGDVEIKKHLLFKKYMINHPKEAEEYSKLKEELAKKYRTNIDKYMEGKNNFIKNILNKAGYESN